MAILGLLLLGLWPWGAPPAYQAVVIDAATRQPLAGVAVTDLDAGATRSTDATGHITLPGPAAHLRLRHLGYAPAEVLRGALPAGQVDTLRLTPQRFALADVVVQGARPVRLSGYAGKLKYVGGVLLVPEYQTASLFRPAPGEVGSVVQRLTAQFRNNHPTAGRVRMRLLPVLPTSPFTPDLTRDLLTGELQYSAAQIAALPNQELTVELASHGIRVPAAGLCLLVEGLPSSPEEQLVELQPPWTVVTATDPRNQATYRSAPADAFPAIMVATSATSVETTSRHVHGLPWRMFDVDNQHKRVENAAVSLTLLAEPAP
ncbi:carboxypeptidase-like regulatory domain-containing protein [Hymenobacter sp. 15J16-1T3B]|uniref:carboxypeptidase-like regulatory domain-containing protein n=1 Tax=Hymenobacter sp. 15J16-1T3B TaxID=2886941 RepID=UPI001D11E3A8|nr:carboxypeptidase-like regulatory domain-containing protein [Hymenobacter sp. 15J16-1T3B]MCC3159545.1 carboxypeptidase-like regulatory domain-containing protein [Hymenobacter sp. 15J16-1T3B]